MEDAGIDPAKSARKIWNDSCMDQGRIAPGPTAQPLAADRTAEVGGVSPVEAMLVATRRIPRRRRASRGCRRTVTSAHLGRKATWQHRHVESSCEEPVLVRNLYR